VKKKNPPLGRVNIYELSLYLILSIIQSCNKCKSLWELIF
jgi:hypothetical protein